MRRGRPELELGPLGPWRATVKVTPLEGIGLPRSGMARRPSTRFEISCSWLGPGLPPRPGDPPTPGPVDVSDSLIIDELDAARALANRAADDLRAGDVPDLRALVRL